MLKHLKISDIEAVVAACNAINAKSTNTVLRMDQIGVDELLKGTPEEKHLDALLESLSDEALMELEALMWTGRDGGEFRDHLAYAHKNKDRGTADYIAEKSLSLPDYLRDGLRALRGGSR